MTNANEDHTDVACGDLVLDVCSKRAQDAEAEEHYSHLAEDENEAPLEFVGQLGQSHSRDCATNVRRNREELCLRALEAHGRCDGGHGELQAVRADAGDEKDPGLAVDFVVGEKVLQVSPPELVDGLIVRVRAVFDGVLDEEVSLLVGIEPAAGERRRVRHDEEACNTDDDGCDTLEQENPGPAWTATDAVHAGDCEGEKA